MPRPPETTIAASVSSGRPVAFFGCESVIRAALAASLSGDLERLDAHRQPATASSGTEFGFTAMIGVPVVTVAVTVYEPAKTDWVVSMPLLAGAHVDGVGDQARPGLDRQAGGDLLARGVARDEHRGRRDLLDERGEDLGLRGDEVARGLRVVDDVDLVRAVLGQGHLGLLGAGADVHGGGLAEAAGDRQQLGGRLAQAPVGVVDENEYFSHGSCPTCQSSAGLR